MSRLGTFVPVHVYLRHQPKLCFRRIHAVHHVRLSMPVSIALMIFIGDRERHETSFDFFDGNGCVSMPARVGCESGGCASCELLVSLSRHDDQLVHGNYSRPLTLGCDAAEVVPRSFIHQVLCLLHPGHVDKECAATRPSPRPTAKATRTGNQDLRVTPAGVVRHRVRAGRAARDLLSGRGPKW